MAYPAQYSEAKSVSTFNMKYLNLDIVFKVLAKRTNSFVKCSGPLNRENYSTCTKAVW